MKEQCLISCCCVIAFFLPKLLVVLRVQMLYAYRVYVFPVKFQLFLYLPVA